MRLGKVVKSNSHCDYIVQLDDKLSVSHPPDAHIFGFGSFVKLEEPNGEHWAVGIIYNTQLVNPMFLSNGPRLSSDSDPFFTPDLIDDTRTLLGIVLVGQLEQTNSQAFGIQGIPRAVVPVNTSAWLMDDTEIYQFHTNAQQQPQFGYYSHLLRCGGSFATDLMLNILNYLIDQRLFATADERALNVIRKELSWKNTVGVIR
ncbi:MAG: hypothetical protein F6K30_25915 [Cyanothece sp. SIO2G6]|nr:hypothetical protein [Cyanothece sp. SIO2G6]